MTSFNGLHLFFSHEGLVFRQEVFADDALQMHPDRLQLDLIRVEVSADQQLLRVNCLDFAFGEGPRGPLDVGVRLVLARPGPLAALLRPGLHQPLPGPFVDVVEQPGAHACLPIDSVDVVLRCHSAPQHIASRPVPLRIRHTVPFLDLPKHAAVAISIPLALTGLIGIGQFRDCVDRRTVCPLGTVISLLEGVCVHSPQLGGHQQPLDVVADCFDALLGGVVAARLEFHAKYAAS